MSRQPPIKNRIQTYGVVLGKDLVPDPRAYRRHPERQRRIVGAYLQKVGWIKPVVARRGKDGSLVILDGALLASLDPEGPVPVVVTDLNEDEAADALFMLDPTAELAGIDEKPLKDLLERVASSSAVVREMAERLARRSGIALLLADDPDLVPPVPVEPRTRPGDLYALGEHRVLCGDARSSGDMARLMENELASCCWTDPPYGVSYRGRTSRHLEIKGDRADGLGTLLSESFAVLDTALRPGAHLYVAHPDGERSHVFTTCFLAQGWHMHQGLVWDKGAPVLGHSDYLFAHEPILYGYKPGPGRLGRGGPRWHGGNDQSSVVALPRPHASREHPTMKPPELIRRHLQNSSKEGEVVLDPFLGSGSTLIACQSIGRRCFGMDIDPGYVDVVIARWEELTGEKARRIHSKRAG